MKPVGGCSAVAVCSNLNRYYDEDDMNCVEPVRGTFWKDGSLQACLLGTYNDKIDRVFDECPPIPLGYGCKGSNGMPGCMWVTECPEETNQITGVNKCGCCPRAHILPPSASLGVRSPEECIPIPPGRYSALCDNYDDAPCVTNDDNRHTYERYCNFDCPEGTYSATRGGKEIESCRPAPMGSYVDKPGSTWYTLCPASTYSDQLVTRITQTFGYQIEQTDVREDHIAAIGATSLSDCLPCRDGYYSSIAGSTACKVIPRGGYSLDKKTLEFCPMNTYSTTEGATSASTCLPCPEDFITRSVGSTACKKRMEGYPFQGSWGAARNNSLMVASDDDVNASSSPLPLPPPHLPKSLK